MLTIEMMTEAVEKLKSHEHETKFVVCSGQDLINNGMLDFNGEDIFSGAMYLVELGNHPFSMKPTLVKPLSATR